MSDNKKYYYLKLKESFYDTDEIKVLEGMPNGYKYSNILLKLYLRSLKNNGALRLNEYIPYNTEMIASITGHDVDTVRIAVDIFKKLKLVEVLEDGTMYMLQIQNLIGESSTEADRKRVYRAKIEEEKKQIGGKRDICPKVVPKIVDKNPPEREIEKELEIELELKREKEDIKSFSLNEKVLDILKFYEQKTSASISSQYEAVKSLCEVYEADDIKEALEKSIERNKKGVAAINYSKGILKNWATEGKPKKEDNHIQKNATKGHFNDYEQRKYDFDDLEKKLLGWDNKQEDDLE